MAKITYSSLKLKLNTGTNKIEGTDIEVLKYLPVEDKLALIDITLQNSKEGSIYNSTKMDIFFHLYLVLMYTNINFTEKQKEEPIKLYDILKSNGLIDKVIENMEEEEYTFLLDCLNQQAKDITEYKNSLAGVLFTFMEQLPERAEEIAAAVENFDPSKFQNVLDFAKAANGGKSIF